MKRKIESSEHMSRLNYLDHFIEENYAQMKIEKYTECLGIKLNMSY